MNNFVINSDWFFAVCALIFVIIIIKSFKIRRKSGRLAASDHRRSGYWIASLCVFVAFLIVTTKIGDSMSGYDGFLSNGNLVYGSMTGEIISAIKDSDSDPDAVRMISIDSENSNYYDDTETGTQTKNDSKQKEQEKQEVVQKGIELKLTEMSGIPSGWNQINPIGTKASNSLQKYPPQMLIDGDISTSWQVTVDKPEKYNSDSEESEWLYFDFGMPNKIDYIVIYNGTPDSESRYFKNGRICGMRVSDLSPDPEDGRQYVWTDILELRDEPYCQIIECNNFLGSELCLRVDTMYPGEKFPELCVSDVMFFSAH